MPSEGEDFFSRMLLNFDWHNDFYTVALFAEDRFLLNLPAIFKRTEPLEVAA
jgi:hypothetical protein